MSKSGGKSISFKVPQSRLAPAADAWIANRGAEPALTDREMGNVTPLPAAGAVLSQIGPAAQPVEAAKEKMTRFTFDVPESLHRRIKVQCAARGVKMTDIMREFLEREFPQP